jgi:hypothetical protein
MKAKRARSAPKAQKRKADDPDQYERFRQFAREHETDQSEEAFERAFKRLVPPKAPD